MTDFEELFDALADLYAELDGGEAPQAGDEIKFSETTGPGLTEEKRAKLRAETAVAEALAREKQAKAVQAALSLERDQEKRVKERADNELHRVYVFDSDVSDGSVKKCIAQLVTWERQQPQCRVEIQINSPGGDIFAGFHLIDYIRAMRKRGCHITMVGLGMIASMAGVLMQAADVRVMGENAFMLIHEGSLGAIGDFGNVEDRVKLMQQMHERILSLFEERAKPINAKTTKAFIRKRWLRKDWWIVADECLKLGLIDSVR